MATPLPWELRLTLRPGTVYYFQHRALTSVEPHYFIVVNRNPIDDEVLLLAVASSKVESVRQRRRQLPPETLVEITPADYREFKLPSIVDCNRVFRKSLAELVVDWNAGNIEPKDDLPTSLLARIQAGMKLSPQVENEAKALIG
jgi:hypothetical protein